MLALVFLLTGHPDDLGHGDYYRREAVEHRLALAGPLAWPALLTAAATSENPEVRLRADRLLAPCRAFAAELRALAALAGPREPDPAAFFFDDQLRLRVYRLAKAAGVCDSCAGWWDVLGLCGDACLDDLHPDCGSPPDAVAAALGRCRSQVREILGAGVPARGVAPLPRTPAVAASDVPDVLPP